MLVVFIPILTHLPKWKTEVGVQALIGLLDCMMIQVEGRIDMETCQIVKDMSWGGGRGRIGLHVRALMDEHVLQQGGDHEENEGENGGEEG